MADHARRALVVTVASLALWVGLAGVAAAHDCSSPRDCEQTAGYNAGIARTGGIVAVGAGLIGVYVGTSAGTMPTIPPAGAPVVTSAPATTPTVTDPVPETQLVGPEGEVTPIIRWEPGKYGPDPTGATGKPGQIWWVDRTGHPRWEDPAKVRVLIDELKADQAQQAESQARGEAWAKDPARHQRDPELVKLEKAIQDSKQKALELKQQGEAEIKQLIRERMEITQAAADRQIAYDKKLEGYATTAGYIGTAADTGISILGNVPGLKGGELAYTFVKRTAAGIASGESVGTAMTQGGIDVVVNVAVDKTVGAVGKRFGVPEVPAIGNKDVAVNTFLKSTGSGQIFVSKEGIQVVADKVVEPWAVTPLKNFAMGKPLEMSTSEVLKYVGIKKGD